MIEVYILVTLFAVGYLLNSQSKQKPIKNASATTHAKVIADMPSMRNVYESKYSNTVDRNIRKMAQDKFELARNANKTNVIPATFRSSDTVSNTIRSMTGELIDKNQFIHNNMTPFYGGSIKQNMDDKSNKSILESFTGVSDLYKKKQEVESFYDRTKDVSNVNGMKSMNDFYMDRIVPPTKRNNEFPLEQVKVGKGLGQGFDAKPTGGFHQFDVQDFAQMPCVGELRTKKNPNSLATGIADVQKQTYSGRIVDGIKEKKQTSQMEVPKYRPETFWEQDHDNLIKTTGAILKKAEVGDFNVKDTNRKDTSVQYIGTAIASTAVKPKLEGVLPQGHRIELQSAGPGIADVTSKGLGDFDDFGKNNIMIYNQERDISSTRVQNGNLTTMVKSIIAPLEDFLKITKKQEGVDNPRHFGNMNAQIPEKPTMYDPNDVARTTIKETLIHDEIGSQVKGPTQLYVYDPDEVAKRTVRETLANEDYGANLAGGARKGTVYDPSDIAKKTIKETTIDLEREYGNIDPIHADGGYKTNEFDAKTTQKQFISDNDYFGTVERDRGMGYVTNEFDAKTTHKQFVSDNQHYGIAASANKEKRRYEDYESQKIEKLTDRKEVTVLGRDPTQTGAKVFNDCMSIPLPKKAQIASLEGDRLNKVYEATPFLDGASITKNKGIEDMENNNRFDISILDHLKDNPYNIPIA
jgi:hypothetical protein